MLAIQKEINAIFNDALTANEPTNQTPAPTPPTEEPQKLTQHQKEFFIWLANRG